MFSNLSKGSILYGLETKGDMKFFTAPIESVSLPRPKNYNSTFGQIPEFVIDIVTIVNGERREFKQVPTNTTIADLALTPLYWQTTRTLLSIMSGTPVRMIKQQ